MYRNAYGSEPQTTVIWNNKHISNHLPLPCHRRLVRCTHSVVETRSRHGSYTTCARVYLQRYVETHRHYTYLSSGCLALKLSTMLPPPPTRNSVSQRRIGRSSNLYISVSLFSGSQWSACHVLRGRRGQIEHCLWQIENTIIAPGCVNCCARVLACASN